MKTYTIEEAINDMALSAGVAHGNGYCNWICSAHLGYSSDKNGGEYAEDKFSTNDESWSTGEFDGETYYPQDYSEWLDDYFKSAFEDVLNGDALALITDKMKEQMFDEWCQKLWSDSANESNYESSDHRNRRIAEQIFWSWEHEEAPDNVFINREKDIVIVLTNDEYNFVSAKADDGDHSYYENLCDGCTTKFVNDYSEDWDDDKEVS